MVIILKQSKTVCESDLSEYEACKDEVGGRAIVQVLRNETIDT